MQIADFMSQRPEFEPQQRSMRDNGIERREDSGRNDFKSFLQDMRTNQDDRKRIKERLDNNRSLSEIAEEMDLESKDELKKLAKEIKEKVKELSDEDEAALEELMALLAEMEALIEKRLAEKLANEESLEELGLLLEELNIDLDLEGVDGDKKDVLAELLSEEDLLAKIANLDEAKVDELFGEKEKILAELKELIAKLQEKSQTGDFELKAENNDSLDDTLAELKNLLADLDGEFKAEEKSANKNSFFLKDMGQNQLLQQKLQLADKEGNVEENSELLDHNLLQEEADIKLLEELSAEEIRSLLSKENEAAEKIGDNLFEFNLANSGAELSFNAENLIQAQSAANEVEFNQFFLSENVLEQVGEELELMNISKGSNELTVELYPESLGKVDINVSLEDGEMVARIVTESNEVRDLMKNNLDGLKDLLQQKNIGIENIEIAVLSEEESLAQNTDQEAGGNNNFASQDGEQREELEFDLEELSEILEMTGIEVSAKDVLTSEDIDYVV